MQTGSYKNLNNLLVDSLSGLNSDTNDLHTALIYHRNELISLRVFDQNIPTPQNIDPRVTLLSKMLDITVSQALFLHSNANDDEISFYFEAREHLLDTLEIIVRYTDFENRSDPYQIINRMSNDVILESDLVMNIIARLLEYSTTISNLEPLPNESTTTLRQEFCGMGATDREIDKFVINLKREIGVLGLILCRIGFKFGFQ